MRRLLTLVAGAALVVGWVGPATGAAAAGAILVGDSVALGAKLPLQAAGVAVDAVVSRSFAQGISVLRAQGQALPARVIVHLGTNSGVTAGQCDELAAVVGVQRSLTLVTVTIPAAPQVASAANSVLATCAGRHGATLVDWAAYTRTNPQVLCGDGIHISCGGGDTYAEFLLAAAPLGEPGNGAGQSPETARAGAAEAERAAAERAAAERAAAEEAERAAAEAERERAAAAERAAEAERIEAQRERLLARLRAIVVRFPLLW